MIIREYIVKKSWGKDLRVDIKCDQCSIEHSRQAKHYKKMKSHSLWDRDYCNSCWRPKIYGTPEYLSKMRAGVKRAYENPELIKRMSEIVKGRNAGDNNPMKRPDVQKKVSETRKKLFRDPIFGPALIQKLSRKSKEAWENGKYIGADTSGESKWYDYLHSDGTVYKVQGRWELKFIQWLDENKLLFTCHKGQIPYIDKQGNSRNYYPDFFVNEWNCYVDVKSSYWYQKQKDKWDCLREQCKDTEIRVLLEKDLRNLGIKL